MSRQSLESLAAVVAGDVVNRAPLLLDNGQITSGRMLVALAAAVVAAALGAGLLWLRELLEPGVALAMTGDELTSFVSDCVSHNGGC